jgi:hypothetical protein
MIPIGVIRKLRLATCAVHRLDVKHEDVIARGGPIGRLAEVRATAFLVRESVLLTNRHVVELVAEEHLRTGNHDHWYVEFGHPSADGKGWSQIFRMWRFGSVVHAGIISGVSPYDGAASRDLTAFLTDINTAGDMSGSPVFMPETGFVIGLHYAGVQGTLGCAVPVDEFRVAGWVRAFEGALAGGKQFGPLKVTGGGDVSEEERTS